MFKLNQVMTLQLKVKIELWIWRTVSALSSELANCLTLLPSVQENIQWPQAELKQTVKVPFWSQCLVCRKSMDEDPLPL